MLQTVVQHAYTGGMAVDTSGFGNHGLPILVVPAKPGFSFSDPGGRINVKPSPSLNTLGLINLQVTFSVLPSGTAHRYNLAEGYLSFALYVDPDLSLSGTILDAAGNWTGATSPPGAVTSGNVHIAGLQSDGINMVRVFLDGKAVASNYGVSGTVRGVGNLGLAIGHWPDPPNQYTFQGTIFAVLLQRYDPASDASLLDACCFSRQKLGGWLTDVGNKGISRDHLVQAAGVLEAATLKAVVAIRGGDQRRTTTHQTLTSALRLAMRQRNSAGVESAMKQIVAFVDSNLDAATRATLADDINKALDQFGLSASDWTKLLAVFCLNRHYC